MDYIRKKSNQKVYASATQGDKDEVNSPVITYVKSSQNLLLNQDKGDRKLQNLKQVERTRKFLAQDKWVIDAESEYVGRWDIVVILALLFTSTVTPYEVVLLSTHLNALFFVNRFIDLIFVKDMGMNFFMSYWEQLDDQTTGQWVKDLKKIRKYYFKSWFWIDLLSILPFDVLGLVTNSAQLEKIHIIRIVRLLRLIKLVRILKASRIYKRLENSIGISFALQSLIKFTFIVVIGSHWLACVWTISGLTSHDMFQPNWISHIFGDENGNFDITKIHFDVYSAAYYFAVMTIATIGYGDITPVNNGERWVCIFIMVIGSSVWAYVLGNACGIVATADADSILYHQMMDNLNLFLSKHKIEPELRKKLRGYFRALRQLRKTRRNLDLVDDMSPNLRDAVTLRSASWVTNLTWHKNTSSNFFAKLIHKMDGAVFSPMEIMPSINHLCVINAGVASKQGKVLLKGKTYGEDLLLNSTFLKDKTPARALTFTELLYINRAKMAEILDAFPQDAKNVRRFTLKIAMQRALLLIRIFSKQNWKYVPGTRIPFASTTAIIDEVGENYEQFVRRLHPDMSNPHQDDTLQLVKQTEKKEKEQSTMLEMLGQNIVRKPIECKCSGVEINAHVEDIEQKVEELSKYLRKLDLAFGQISMKLETESLRQPTVVSPTHNVTHNVLFINDNSLMNGLDIPFLGAQPDSNNANNRPQSQGSALKTKHAMYKKWMEVHDDPN